MKKALESDFQFPNLDSVAEKESYRKEVYRPIYHMHKWWAQRLGSVFRAIIMSSVSEDKDIHHKYYQKNSFENKVVFDPFMGSGTTVGEALKLGCKAIGSDINPVSSFIVKNSLNYIPTNELIKYYELLESKVRPTIQKFYTKKHPNTGENCKVLYYFWVRELKLPSGSYVPLFSNYVFSRNAYPKKKPESKIICPNCFEINTARYDTEELNCASCNHKFNPQVGPVKGSIVTDPVTNHQHKIIDLVKKSGQKLSSKMYAALVLKTDGTKEYLPIDNSDIELYEKAKFDYLQSEYRIEEIEIETGHNTDQARNYNFKYWTDLFNYRQLHCLTILLNAINEIDDKGIRNQFLTLFSGTLEFNNMFCSFKGEGTGAVRHIFYNHILKPERVPLENSIWGFEKGSGTFSSLFKSRLIRAKQYMENPFELNVIDGASKKVYCNDRLEPRFVDNFSNLLKTKRGCLILNKNGSNVCQIPDESVDAVVTDPPYFDYVHYSELSDFFYSWLKPCLEKEDESFRSKNSRREGEVQNRKAIQFSKNLSLVFKECNRVLKKEGLMVFSFHHSRSEGWSSIFRAIHDAGFYIEKTYPVKAEMSVSTPKNQAKSPINIDALIVCKKLTKKKIRPANGYMEETIRKYKSAILDFDKVDRILSDNDKRVIFYSKLIESISLLNDVTINFDDLINKAEFVEN